MAWKISFTCGHAAGLPPGMIEGPLRAPSSPPDTPVPMKSNALFRKVLGAAAGIRPVRIAPVNDDVALFQVRQDLLNHVVDGVARLHHQHDAPRAV